MGYWGTGLFQNDGAGDFVYGIIPGGWSLIRQVLSEASPRYAVAEALVCAELLTWALGRGRYDEYRALEGFLEVHGTSGATPALVRKAIALLDGIERTHQGWRDPKSEANHKRLVANIRSRLEKSSITPAPARNTRRGGRSTSTRRTSRGSRRR